MKVDTSVAIFIGSLILGLGIFSAVGFLWIIRRILRSENGLPDYIERQFSNYAKRQFPDYLKGDFPDYAKREVVYKRYDSLLQAIDKAAKQSRSVRDLEYHLWDIEHPENLAYLGLEKDGSTTDLIGSKGEIHTIVRDGVGYGQMDGRDIIVIHHRIVLNHRIGKFFGARDCVIYLWKE